MNIRNFFISEEIIWQRLIPLIRGCFSLWCFWFFFFFLYRIILIQATGSVVSNSDIAISDYWLCFTGGAKFDMSISTIILLPLLLVGVVLLGSEKYDRWISRCSFLWILSLTFVTVVLGTINIFFFIEYKEQFNHWIFGLFYDDTLAILKTVWEDTPVIWASCLIVLVYFLLVKAQFFLLKKSKEKTSVLFSVHSRWYKIFFFIGFVLVVVGSARGGFRGRPIQLKDAYVCQSEHLNHCVPNFYKSLQEAFKNHFDNLETDHLPEFVPSKNIKVAAQILFGEKGSCGDIDSCLQRSAKGIRTKPPKHIFLVIMESYDSWAMLDPGRAFGLTPELSSIAKEGAFFPNFISSGSGTMDALNVFFTGLPYNGMMANYMRGAKHPFPTSIAPIFKRLGYKTRFFYGGYMSWQRCGDFAKEQGFDEIIGANLIKPGKALGTWGIPDKDLFEFLVSFTEKSEEPTFNVVLSLSYHRPFDRDIYAEGFKDPVLPPELDKIYDKKSSLYVLGHQWYSDKYLGIFLRTAAKKLERPLIAVTGDHWSREFYCSTPQNYDKGVPLVLYGPGFLEQTQCGISKTPGDHVDIIPTLVELVAPKDFSYHAFGHSMFEDGEHFGGGMQNIIVTSQAWFTTFGLENSQSVIQGEKALDRTECLYFVQKHNAEKSISWWRLMRGSDLEKQSKKGNKDQ